MDFFFSFILAVIFSEKAFREVYEETHSVILSCLSAIFIYFLAIPMFDIFILGLIFGGGILIASLIQFFGPPSKFSGKGPSHNPRRSDGLTQ